MTTSTSHLATVAPDDAILRVAVAAHLARYKGASRDHVDSDLRSFLIWCRQRQMSPLDATRPQIELYVRWMQEIQGYKPSTVSRRLSVIVGFYRTCVIDSILDHSPADYVRRPHVPPESPTLGLSHLQFEAMLTAGRRLDQPQRLRARRHARPSRTTDLRGHRQRHRASERSTATAYCACTAKATRSSSIPCRPQSPARSTEPSLTGSLARSC